MTTRAIGLKAERKHGASNMPMQQINSPDRVLQTIQTNAAKAISDLESATRISMTAGSSGTTAISTPFVGGNLLTGVSLTAGQSNIIAHGLGHTPSVWVLTDQNANAVVWRASWTATQINLICSADCTVSFWAA